VFQILLDVSSNKCQYQNTNNKCTILPLVSHRVRHSYPIATCYLFIVKQQQKCLCQNVFHFLQAKKKCLLALPFRAHRTCIILPHLINLSNCSVYITSNDTEMEKMWQLWPNLRQYSIIFMRKLRKTMPTSPTFDRDSNPGLHNTMHDGHTPSYKHVNCKFHTKRLSHTAIFCSRSHGSQNTTNQHGQHVPSVRSTKYIFTSGHAKSSGNYEVVRWQPYMV
jgi:hypothetical protein